MRLALLSLALVVACNHQATTSDAGTTPADATATDRPPAPDLAPGADGEACSIEEAMHPDEGGMHVAACAAISHGSNPPSSGTHYPSWPIFRVYDKPVPWGFLIHGLEHGAVVIVYNCPTGCPDQLAALKAMVEASPTRPGCSRPPIIVSPDPTLDVPFAASAWGYTLRAQCFDQAAFASFVERHANKGPENIPSDCGALDREATGWCP
jgi:hypothetical protein